VTKPIFGKSSLWYGLLAFGLSLVVLLASAASGGAIPSLYFIELQAVAIGVSMGIIEAFIHGRRLTANQGSTGQGQANPLQRADTDPLTQLLNERGLTVKLLELMALGERYGNSLSIAIIGIDHLGEVAEKYSQQVADKALVAIENELTDSLRMPDVLGRWAEDQFIAVLPETPLDGARHIGERLREAVSRATFEGKRGVVLTITASIGVTVYRLGDDLQGLLSRATRAMNAARSQGCDRVSTDLAA